MSEIITTQPLCWILDNEGNRHYKECSLEELQIARDKKKDIRVWDSLYIDSEWKTCKRSGEEMLTDYQISKYWKADIVDRFLYFALPKYPKKIKDRFKISVSNMTKERRKDLSYDAIMITLESWIKEESYYQ